MNSFRYGKAHRISKNGFLQVYSRYQADYGVNPFPNTDVAERDQLQRIKELLLHGMPAESRIALGDFLEPLGNAAAVSE